MEHGTGDRVRCPASPGPPGGHPAPRIPRGKHRFRKRLCNFKNLDPLANSVVRTKFCCAHDPMAGTPGRPEGATAEKAVPFPTSRLWTGSRSGERQWPDREYGRIWWIALWSKFFPASDPPPFMAIGAPRPSYTHLSRTGPATKPHLPSSLVRQSGNGRDQQSTKTWRPA